MGEPNKEWAAEVRKQMYLKGLNARTLSEKVDLSYGYMRLLLSGKNNSMVARRKISKYLGIDDD